MEKRWNIRGMQGLTAAVELCGVHDGFRSSNPPATKLHLATVCAEEVNKPANTFDLEQLK